MAKKTKESRSFLDEIKEEMERKSGSNFAKILRLGEDGAKKRVRFLKDFNKGFSLEFHESNEYGEFSHPCLEQYGKDCPNCDNKDGKVVKWFFWPVYDYESGEVKVLKTKATKASMVPSMANAYEITGDITSQDMYVTRNGTGFDTRYMVMPSGNVKKLKDVDCPTKKEMLQWIYDAFNNYGEDYEPEDEEEDEEEEEEVKPKKKAKKKEEPKKKKKRPEPEEEDDDEDDEYDDDEDDFDDEEDDDEPPFDDDEEEEELPKPKKKKKKR